MIAGGGDPSAPAVRRQPRRRTIAMVAAIIVVPVVAAYAVLWVGGAIEILTYKDASADSSCTIVTSISSAEVGQEESWWVGGGVLGRPGVVCVPQPAPRSSLSPAGRADLSSPEEWTPPNVDRRLTQADVLSAILAVLVFVVAAVGVEHLFRRSDERSRSASAANN